MEKVVSATTQPPDPEAETKMAKLRLEVAELQWKVRWAYKVGQFVSVITAFLAIGAILVSIYQINAAYEQDFKKPVWEKQLKVLGEITETASAIAVLPTRTDERKKAELKFEQLYWGPVAITENDELKILMGKFMKCYTGADEDCECFVSGEVRINEHEGFDCETKKTRLQDLSMDIGKACRMKVGRIWDIKSLMSTSTEKPADEPAALIPMPDSTELP